MILSKDVLFVHVPKTGGTSVRTWAYENLPGEVLCVGKIKPQTPPVGQTRVLNGNKHGDLYAARPLVQMFTGHDLPQLPLILACMRNPYDREVAWYLYWMRNQKSARELNVTMTTFEAFVERGDTLDRRFASFYGLPDVELPNLRRVRTETLDQDVRAALTGIGIDIAVPVPHLNVGPARDWRSFYTPATEAAVFRRYGWMFEEGLYTRLDEDFTGIDNNRPAVLEGPVQTLGGIDGLHGDGWAGPDLGLTLRPLHAIGELVIEAVLPRDAPPAAVLMATIGDDRSTITARPGEVVHWRLDCPAAAGQTVPIRLQAGWVTTADDRRLAFELKALRFS